MQPETKTQLMYNASDFAFGIRVLAPDTGHAPVSLLGCQYIGHV